MALQSTKHGSNRITVHIDHQYHFRSHVGIILATIERCSSDSVYPWAAYVAFLALKRMGQAPLPHHQNRSFKLVTCNFQIN